MYGKCRDSQVWQTRDADANAVGDAFRSAVSSFPYIGGFVAGFIGDTLTNNAIRQCPGAVTDYTTPYRQTYILIGLVVIVAFVYYLIPKK